MPRARFIGGSNDARSVQVDAQRCVNIVPELDPQSKYQMAAYQRPGLATWANVGAAGIRGFDTFNGELYTAVGAEVRKVSTSGAVTSIGTLSTDKGPVGMAHNPSQLAIVDGAKGYYSDGSSLSEISDPSFPNGATHIGYIDAVFLVNDPSNAGRFYQSDTNSATGWNALNFATAERDPDHLDALLIDHREVWLFGRETTEVWTGDGSTGVAFSPVSGGFTEVGIAAPHSAAKAGDAVYWVAQARQGGPAVFRAMGLKGERISTPSVEDDIAAAGDLSLAVGSMIYFRGHLLYVLTLPGGKTLVHDSSTGLWSEWRSQDRNNFRCSHFIYFNGALYAGDDQDGNIFRLDPDVYDDAGAPIMQIRRDRFINAGDSRRMLKHKALEVEFEMGQGDPLIEPQAAMRYSDDGGHTWSREWRRGLGRQGEYDKRARWGRLGAGRDRVYEISVSAAAKTVWVSGFLDLA